MTDIAVVGLVVLALLFDYTNGFHDSANSVATVIATRVLRPRFAVLWAAGFNFIAFLVFGTAVADTVGKVVKPGAASLAVVFAALVGAVLWNYLSWYLGLPTSSSHALVGALVGAGLTAGGLSAINGKTVLKTAEFIVISPVTGLILGYVLLVILRKMFERMARDKVDRGFRVGQLFSSAAISLGHGGNDAQKTMGIITVLLISTGHLAPGSGVPDWVALAAASAIAAGTASGGWRIMQTMGMKITQVTPIRGFAAESAAAIALFGSTAVGAPVSTTHTVAGAISGVGTASKEATVDWTVMRRVVAAWFITMPFAGVVAAFIYWMTTEPPAALSAVLLVALLGTLAVLIGIAMVRGPKAHDVDPEKVKPATLGAAAKNLVSEPPIGSMVEADSTVVMPKTMVIASSEPVTQDAAEKKTPASAGSSAA